ncbi:hypothetical protein LAZ67_5001970, partial [Cordylochernes scorpioides]
MEAIEINNPFGILAESQENGLQAHTILSANPQVSAELSAKDAEMAESHKDANSEPAADGGHANFRRNWADCPELNDQLPDGEDGIFTTVGGSKKRPHDPDHVNSGAKKGCVQAPRIAPNSSRPRATPRASRVHECQTTRQKQATFRARSAAMQADQCVYLEFCPDFTEDQYFLALEAKLGKGTVYQLTKMEGQILVGLSGVQQADKLVEDGLEIEDALLRATPLKKRAERIMIGNVPFFVENLDLVAALRPYGQITSIVQKMKELGESYWADARREAFITLRDGVKLSQPHGHKRANCPRKTGVQEANLLLHLDPPAGPNNAGGRQPSSSNVMPAPVPTPAAGPTSTAAPIPDASSAPPSAPTTPAAPPAPPAAPAPAPETLPTASVNPVPPTSKQSRGGARKAQKKSNLTWTQLNELLGRIPSKILDKSGLEGLQRDEILDALASVPGDQHLVAGSHSTSVPGLQRRHRAPRSPQGFGPRLLLRAGGRCPAAARPVAGKHLHRLNRRLRPGSLSLKEVDIILIRAKFERLTILSDRLILIDDKIKEILMDDLRSTEAQINDEMEQCETYSLQVGIVAQKVKEYESKLAASCDDKMSQSSTSDVKRQIKLPKFELKKYTGELEEWLSWWSHFEKIHLDESLSDVDKFEYLIQSMVVGSKAHRLVTSFPLTQKNYNKVIGDLKDRFGDRDMLTELYVRKLLKLVIASARSEKRTLAQLYDDLVAHLHSLGSLGVDTKSGGGAFLYPLVESSLPLELIKIWQRSRTPFKERDYSEIEEGIGHSGAEAFDKLEGLIEFLKQEVKNAERISFVAEGFEPSLPLKQGKRENNPPKIHTASALFVGKTNLPCLFCDKDNHLSQNCFKAAKMLESDRLKRVQDAKVCFKCLRKNHLKKDCRSFVRCKRCQGPHFEIMCRGTSHSQENLNWRSDNRSHNSLAEQNEGNSEPVTAMANQVCTNNISLMTLIVKIKGPKRSKMVRVLLDSGSQKSYIRRSLAKELDLPKVGEVKLNKFLFGGQTTGEKAHSIFYFQLDNVDEEKAFKMEALEETIICGNISPVETGPRQWELDKKGITLTKVDNNKTEIDILIGGDYYGQLLTGKIEQLAGGLTAIQTVLGWTLIGNTSSERPETSAQMVITLLTTQQRVASLWELETIGIRDPTEVISVKEKNVLMQEKFREKICRGQDGRYLVSLPWKEGIGTISNNLEIAKRRLEAMTQKLTQKETGPNLIELLPEILIRLREKKIGAIADIRKAFQTVGIDEKERFHKEYLAMLVQKRNETEGRRFLPGEVVLIGRDDQKRIFWPLGRILELYPGKDGRERVARVRTAMGEFVRPLKRLFSLELGSDISREVRLPKTEGIKAQEIPTDGEQSIFTRLSDHRAVLTQMGSPPSPRQPCVAAMLRSALVDEHLLATIEITSGSIADMSSEALWIRWSKIKAELLAEVRSLHVPRVADDDHISRARRYLQARLEAASSAADYPSLPDLVRSLRVRRPAGTTIRDEDGSIIDGGELRRRAYSVYQRRFACEFGDPIAAAEFIRGTTTTLTLEEDDPLTRPDITGADIAAAIRRLPLGKAPGWDELPCEFLISYEDFFVEALRRVFEASKLRGALPSSIRRSTICLVPKSNGGPGLSGYRPISLPTADYRVLGNILLQRLRPHLPALVPRCQTYTVPGRSPSWNVARVADEIDMATRNGSELAVISTDLESAFDTLDRCFLVSLMVSLRLPPAFVEWFLLLYAGADAAVLAGGLHTKPFHLLNGVRQGCAISAAFFSLATGPLLVRLERALGPGNVLAYADDIVLLIRRDEFFDVVRIIFEDFRRASGIGVNFAKCKGLWCGAWRARTDAQLGISWTSEQIRVLGCNLTPAVSSSAQEQHLLALLESAVARWVPFTRGLSLVGRARAANSLVLSAVVHHLHGYLPTDSTIAKLQARLVRFVWGPRRTTWLPGGVLARPVSVGGFGLLDIGTQLRLACLRGVQTALRGGLNAYSWFAVSGTWLTPPTSGTWHPPRRRLLKLWEAVSEILELNHRVLPPHQLQELHIIGDSRFLRPPDLLVASRWAGMRVGDLTSSSSLPLRTTRAALADIAALTTFCSRIVEENRNHTHRVDNIKDGIVLRGTATAFQRLTTRTARRMLERPRLAALPITQLLARWLPHVSIPISIIWPSLRRGAFSGHNADVAVRLALHALPHPAHPASARKSCIACGSEDLSLAHRYWSCRRIRYGSRSETMFHHGKPFLCILPRKFVFLESGPKETACLSN